MSSPRPPIRATGRRRRQAGSDRRGIALVVVILVLVALSLTGHGALVLARGEGVAARAMRRVGLARLTAGWSARATAARLSTDTLPLLGVGGRATLAAGPDGVSLLERLSREFFLVIRTTVADPRGPRVSARRLLWALEPLARVGSVQAVLAVGGAATASGPVDATDFFLVTEADGAACVPWTGGLDSLAITRPAPLPVGSLVTVTGDLRSESGPALRVGLLGPDSLVTRLPSFPPGPVTPRPRTGAATCLDAPENWGSPSDPLGPCGRRWVSIVVPGSLTLDGGEGQGVVVVRGDLVLRGSARLAGLVLVGGDLTVEEGSGIRGMVRVDGNATVDSGSRIRGAACPVLAALSASPNLRRPLALTDPLLPGR